MIRRLVSRPALGHRTNEGSHTPTRIKPGRLDSEMENYVAEFALPEFRAVL